VAWESARGPIPQGLTVDHKCLTHFCCNVDHLQLVSASENSSLAGRRLTHCCRGHSFSAPGVVRIVRSNGRRSCRLCGFIHDRIKLGFTEQEATAMAMADHPDVFLRAAQNAPGIVVVKLPVPRKAASR
jgi:hypothetical protein